MKSLRFFIPIILFFQTPCIAQKYLPFPDSCVWGINIYEHSTPSGLPDQIVNTCAVYTNGDTLINGLKYKRIKNNCDSYYANLSIPPIVNGFLRQDTISRTVYFKSLSSDSCESILYDFNIKVGDTVQRSPCIYNCPKGKTKIDCLFGSESLDQIDSIKLGNIFHRQFFNWIEGIGSEQGLFYNNRINTDLEYHYPALICFNGKTISGNQSCPIILELPENPTTSMVYLSYSSSNRAIMLQNKNPYSFESNVMILNVLGNIVYQGTLTLNSGSNQIYTLSNEKEGLYLIHVFNNRFEISTKIVNQ